jgi:hypothetical protein
MTKMEDMSEDTRKGTPTADENSSYNLLKQLHSKE